MQLIHHVFIIQVQKKHRIKKSRTCNSYLNIIGIQSFNTAHKNPPTLKTSILQLQQTETGLISQTDLKVWNYKM